MIQRRHILCLTLVCLIQATLVFADTQSQECQPTQYCEPDCCEPLCNKLTYSPLRISAAGIIGKGIGDNDENATLELFYAPEFLSSREWQPFINLKGHHLGSSDSSWAANAGLGIRWLSGCDRTLGFNIFYDYRTHLDRNFNQIGFGLESLGETVDFRINGYFPFNNKKTYGVLFDDYIGDYFVVASQYCLPMAGVDGEVGVTLLNNGFFGLYAAIGPYYYKTVDNPQHVRSIDIFGGMARASIQCTDYITLEGRVTYDKHFKTKAQGVLTLTLPFDSCFDICKWTQDTCANIFLKPVARREVIVLDHPGILWLGNY